MWLLRGLATPFRLGSLSLGLGAMGIPAAVGLVTPEVVDIRVVVAPAGVGPVARRLMGLRSAGRLLVGHRSMGLE